MLRNDLDIGGITRRDGSESNTYGDEDQLSKPDLKFGHRRRLELIKVGFYGENG